MKNPHSAHFDPWDEAVGLIHRWLEHAERLDELMERVSSLAVGVERSRVQHLVYGVFRHHIRLQSRFSEMVGRPPRFRVQAILYVAGFELIEAMSDEERDAQIAKVVHHAVEKGKQSVARPEAGLLNAVLRRLARELDTEAVPPALCPARILGSYFSHPEWLVSRWLIHFGAQSTRALLEWNQTPAPVYVRWRRMEHPVPEWLKPTAWKDFYVPESGRWREIEALVASGHLYVQDPSTRLAVDLLDVKPGEAVLDLCAAPGGKSVMLADRMGEGQLVAVDLPGQRQERLRQNLGRVCGVESFVLQSDVARSLGRSLAEEHLPLEFGAVLLDAPCSNTGVMRHRVDVKERLVESDIRKHARQQLGLLMAGALRVAPKGRLVYSTCSIDAEENESVVKAFLEEQRGAFELEKQILSYPWESGHDGAGVFRLRRMV